MGTIVDPLNQKEFVEENLKAYIRSTTETYTKLFRASPSFVTYYSLDLHAGGNEAQLGGARQIVGDRSPLRYSEIKYFPIYGLGEIIPRSAYDEIQGNSTEELTGEVYILAGTIQPAENDIFVFEHLDVPLLFQVTEVHADRLEGKSYFQLNYRLIFREQAEIREQVSEEYDFDLSAVGKKHLTPIVTRDYALQRRKLTLLLDYFKDAYWQSFWLKGANRIVLFDSLPTPDGVFEQGIALVDPYLEYFLHKNRVLDGGGYMRARYVAEPIEFKQSRGVFHQTIYPKTLYGVWERNLRVEDSVPEFIDSLSLGYLQAKTAERQLHGYINHNEKILLTTHIQDGTIALGLENFSSVRKDDSDFEDHPLITRLIIQILSGDFDTTDNIEIYADNSNDTSLFEERSDMFWLLPVIIAHGERMIKFEGRTVTPQTLAQPVITLPTF